MLRLARRAFPHLKLACAHGNCDLTIDVSQEKGRYTRSPRSETLRADLDFPQSGHRLTLYTPRKDRL
jgi:hypothetical protein